MSKMILPKPRFKPAAPKLTIREATNVDRYWIIEHLQNDAFRKEFAGNSFWFNLSTILGCQLLYAIRNDEGALVGYAACNLFDTTIEVNGKICEPMCIEIIEIFPRFRRLGAGRLCVEELKKIAIESCFADDFAVAIRCTSTGDALPFWLKLGFTKERERENDNTLLLIVRK
jgi:ribosomal protein S18 acetylase RimI-like enzyme